MSKDLATIEPRNMIEMLERAAMNPEMDVEKMERLLGVAERMHDRKAEQDYNESMMKAQKAVAAITPDQTNAAVKGEPSWYASYAALDALVRPIYTKHGFALQFGTEDTDKPETVRVRCRIKHRGGHTESEFIDMPADGKGAKGGDVMTKTHATGSAMTYGKRQLLKAIFNIAEKRDPSDDDGNAAGGSVKTITEAQAQKIEGILDKNSYEVRKRFMQRLADGGIEKVRDMPVDWYGGSMMVIRGLRDEIELETPPYE
jgi:hypothetical protein